MDAATFMQYGRTDLGAVGRALTKYVPDRSRLALLTCEIAEEMARARGDKFSRNDWHDYMAQLRDKAATKASR